jgi:probable O-glycosylation ligase (exosortase A-associated)
MRQALLIPIVGIICLIAPFQPLIGLYGYIWFALMRPDVLAYSIQPYSLALAVTTLVGSIRFVFKLHLLFRSPIGLGLLLLQIPIFLSVVFAHDRSLTYQEYTQYIHMMVMAFLIPVFIETVTSLRWLIYVMAFSLGFLGSKWGIYGVIHGGVRFSQGFGGLLADNNAFALALAMGIPFCWYARELAKGFLNRTMFLVMAAATVPAIIFTYSRGAALSLAAVMLMIGFRSKKKAGFVLLAVFVLGGSIYMVKESYLDRLSTVKVSPTEQSAALRVLYIKVAFHMWRDHPLLGVGFGMLNEMDLMDRYTDVSTVHGAQVIHNTYMQMLCDSGIVAFLLYITILFGSILWLEASIRRMNRSHPHLAIYPMAIQTSLVAFAIGGTFLSRVGFDLTYIVMLAGAAWYNIEKNLPPPVTEIEAEKPTTWANRYQPTATLVKLG